MLNLGELRLASLQSSFLLSFSLRLASLQSSSLLCFSFRFASLQSFSLLSFSLYSSAFFTLILCFFPFSFIFSLFLSIIFTFNFFHSPPSLSSHSLPLFIQSLLDIVQGTKETLSVFFVPWTISMRD